MSFLVFEEDFSHWIFNRKVAVVSAVSMRLASSVPSVENIVYLLLSCIAVSHLMPYEVSAILLHLLLLAVILYVQISTAVRQE